jgi:carboxymethylenebutenolidase
MKAAFDLLAARKDVDPKRIGIAGWCMGGGYALTLGIEEPRLAAVIVNYGRLVTDPNTIKKIKAPVMGNFGATDKGIPPEDVKKFAQQLAEFKIGNDFKIYDGAGHGFMNPNNKTGYDAVSADDAWKRMDAFFAANLQK